MGWRDESLGLGKEEQGITKPIEVMPNIYRFGLGYHGYEQGLSQLADEVEEEYGEKKFVESSSRRKNDDDQEDQDEEMS